MARARSIFLLKSVSALADNPGDAVSRRTLHERKAAMS